jgi:hypothetical protein
MGRPISFLHHVLCCDKYPPSLPALPAPPYLFFCPIVLSMSLFAMSNVDPSNAVTLVVRFARRQMASVVVRTLPSLKRRPRA